MEWMEHVKIAFVGKGGSGKTTLSSLLIRHLASTGRPLLAVDADINQHLATALGATEAEAAALPTLGGRLAFVKDYLRGSNPRIGSSEEMIKTTPPGSGSRLLGIDDDNPVWQECVRLVRGVRLAVTGPFEDADLGVACYHSKVGAVELLLNHLVDGKGEYVVVVRDSLPYAWQVISTVAAQLEDADREVPFADHEVAPPSEEHRGQLLRALASDAIRGGLERHFGVRLAFQNCHRVAAFRPAAVGGASYEAFVSPRGQLLNQSPELRDC